MPYADPARRKQWQRDRYHRNRRAAIERLGGRCVVCGTTEDLEFDHIDPSLKSFKPTHVFSGMSFRRRERELEKCQLLCRPHHQAKTQFVDDEEPKRYARS